jgi:hypothetical protein
VRVVVSELREPARAVWGLVTAAPMSFRGVAALHIRAEKPIRYF